MINEYDIEKLKTILKDNNGRHSDRILKEIMRSFSCGPTKASRLLHEAVRTGLARLEGLKVYRR